MLCRLFSRKNSELDMVLKILKKKIADQIKQDLKPDQSSPEILSTIIYKSISCGMTVKIFERRIDSPEQISKVGNRILEEKADREILENIIRSRNKTAMRLNKTKYILEKLAILSALAILIAEIVGDDSVTNITTMVAMSSFVPFALIILFQLTTQLISERSPPQKDIQITSLTPEEIDEFCLSIAHRQYVQFQLARGLRNPADATMSIEELNRHIETCDFGAIPKEQAVALLRTHFKLNTENLSLNTPLIAAL